MSERSTTQVKKPTKTKKGDKKREGINSARISSMDRDHCMSPTLQ